MSVLTPTGEQTVGIPTAINCNALRPHLPLLHLSSGSGMTPMSTARRSSTSVSARQRVASTFIGEHSYDGVPITRKRNDSFSASFLSAPLKVFRCWTVLWLPVQPITGGPDLFCGGGTWYFSVSIVVGITVT